MWKSNTFDYGFEFDIVSTFDWLGLHIAVTMYICGSMYMFSTQLASKLNFSIYDTDEQTNRFVIQLTWYT